MTTDTITGLAANLRNILNLAHSTLNNLHELTPDYLKIEGDLSLVSPHQIAIANSVSSWIECTNDVIHQINNITAQAEQQILTTMQLHNELNLTEEL